MVVGKDCVTIQLDPMTVFFLEGRGMASYGYEDKRMMGRVVMWLEDHARIGREVREVLLERDVARDMLNIRATMENGVFVRMTDVMLERAKGLHEGFGAAYRLAGSSVSHGEKVCVPIDPYVIY